MTTKNGAFGKRQSVGSLQGNNVTLGAVTGSGAMFDPGTFPTPGDTLGTDCAYAYQAALCYAAGITTWPAGFTSKQALRSGSPGSTTTPLPVQWISPGSYPFWNAGTSPAPFLRMSGRQSVASIGLRNGRAVINYNTALAAIVTPATTVAWTNPYAYALIVAIGVNGATMSGATPVLVNATALLVPSGAATTTLAKAAAAWTSFNGTVYVCVQPGGTITLAYSAGTPTLVAYLAFEMFNADPAALGADTKRIEYSLRAKPSGPGASIIPRTRTTEGPIPRRLRPSPSRRSSRPPAPGPIPRARSSWTDARASRSRTARSAGDSRSRYRRARRPSSAGPSRPLRSWASSSPLWGQPSATPRRPPATSALP